MDILYLLVPMSVFVMLAILGLFAWALRAGQFDDLDVAGAHILAASDVRDSTELDPHQAPTAAPLQQSTHAPRPRHRSSP